MRKLLAMLVILFIFYIGIQLAFKYFGYGHQINYSIKKDNLNVLIDEKYVTNTKNESDNYRLKMTINNETFDFQTYYDFSKAEMVIKDFEYYEDDSYKCILPIFKDKKILFDFLCIGKKLTTFYNNIKGDDSKLDSYINSLDTKNYSVSNFVDNKDNPSENGTVTTYPSNIINNHYISMSNYKGLYTTNNANFKKTYSVEIFAKDIYERKISGFVDNYYITADYESKYDFNVFYLINVTNNKIRKIISNEFKISFDSYVQGSLGKSLYVYDRTNQKQYEIKTNTLSVVEIGNSNTGIKIYNDGTWETLKIGDLVKKDIYFSSDTSTNDNQYIKIDKAGNEKSGYYYYYQKNGSKYDLYRSNVSNDAQKVYLCTMNSIDKIKYIDDYVYFVEGNEIKYYHDSKGIRTLLKNTELTFNANLIYSIYSKK